MADFQIYLKKYLALPTAMGGSASYSESYEARNITSFDQQITIPVQAFAMPESASDDAILTKAEGNTEKITFSWIIKDEDVSPARNASGTPQNTWTRASDNTTWDPRTTEGAYVYFINTFEKEGISDGLAYEFQMWDDSNNKNLISRYGVISRIGIQKGANDPATYNATIEFQVGTDVTVDDE